MLSEGKHTPLATSSTPAPGQLPRRSSSSPSTIASSAPTSPGDDHGIRQDEEEISTPTTTTPGPDIEKTAVGPLQHRPSDASSVRELEVVPRSRRRGWLARLALVPEVTRPYDYAAGTKWSITTIVALAASVGSMGSGIFYPALGPMAAQFDTTPTIINLSVAMYMLALAIFPLWWSSFSEEFGRRTVYLVSFGLYVVFSVLSAVSTNTAMLVAMRLLSGGASASVQAVGAGTIADIWEPRERGKAMGMFYLGPLMGPLLAPILGGILSQELGWQSTMWFLAIYGAVVFFMVIFLLPETLAAAPAAAVPAPATLPKSAAGAPLARIPTAASSIHHASKTAAAHVRRLFVDPLAVLLILRTPAVAVIVYYAAVTFGSLFALNISVQAAFSALPYDFDQLIIGLLYLPTALGYIIAAVVGGRWIDRIMAREAERARRYDDKGKLQYLPEDRMRENAWIAATLYPASLIFYGWAVQRGLFWFVPCVPLFVFGLASMLVFSAATTMLTEFVRKSSSSGVAVNNFVRNILSCAGVVAAQPLIDVMGHGWLFTILGLFTWVSGYVCIWVLQRYGPSWRKKMAVDL